MHTFTAYLSHNFKQIFDTFSLALGVVQVAQQIVECFKGIFLSIHLICKVKFFKTGEKLFEYCLLFFDKIALPFEVEEKRA